MNTVRQIGDLLSDGQNRKLFSELGRYRADVPEILLAELAASSLATAAMATIRLQELAETRKPVYRTLIARLLAGQEPAGGWGTTMVTALVIRALLNDPTHDPASRAAARRGIALLAQVQKEDGSLPGETVRRLPADPLATAFALAHLARSNDFAASFRLEAALHALTVVRATVDPAIRPLIELAIQRTTPRIAGQAAKLVQLAFKS